MITEDYVSFEVAKLLKEKGFPQEYDIYHSLVYNEEDYEDEYEVQRMMLETKLVKAGTLSSYPIGVPEPKCYCCTLQMAMKWLREIHNIGIFSFTYTHIEDRKTIHSYGTAIINLKTYELMTDSYLSNDTYENAVETAIKYCLENLI